MAGSSSSPRPRRKNSVSALLYYIVASLLGCSSSIFVFTLYSLTYQEPIHDYGRQPDWNANAGIRDLPSIVSQSRHDNSFGKQAIRTSSVGSGYGHDDYFKDRVPGDTIDPSHGDSFSHQNRSQKDMVAVLRDRMEERKKHRHAHNEVIRERKRLEQISGGLFSGEDSYETPKGKHHSYRRDSEGPQSLLGKVMTDLYEYFFGYEDEYDGRRKQPRPHKQPPNLQAPIEYSPEELRIIRKQRIRAWEKDGVFYNYSIPAVKTNTTLPLPAASHSNDLMVVIVLSSRSNHLHRQAIRETWASNHSVYFVVGGMARNESSSIQEQLVKESKQYGDIIDSILPESYMSLPYKLHFAYQWVVNSMTHVKWILKADDDTVVRVGTLQHALLDLYNPDLPIVLGRIVPHALVNRKGKWAEFQYSRNVYPYWPQGSRGHVVSRPVASYIASQRNLTYYQGEDTSLGIWLDDSPLNVWWIHSPFFQNHAQCQDENALVIGHKLGPDDIRSCFERLDEWKAMQQEDKFLYVESRRQRKILKSEAKLKGQTDPRERDPNNELGEPIPRSD